MAEIWGPWIEHDGAGCPVVGLYVHVVTADGREVEGVASSGCANPPPGYRSLWIWSSLPIFWRHRRVVRYRIRRPDALRRLIDLAADPDRGMPQRFPVEELA